MQHSPHAQYRTRKIWIILAGMLMVTLVVSGCGAAATKVYRVGILSGLDFFANTADGFKAKMTELGYVEGQNLVIECRWDGERYERPPAFATELVNFNLTLRCLIYGYNGSKIDTRRLNRDRPTGIPTFDDSCG